MNNMVTPKIEKVAEARAYGKYEISPLERGYGITLGNALRRVMLSSMEGAAVTSIRITEVDHEYDTIPGVQEDVLRLMLNVKKLCLILHEGDLANMHLDVKGEGVVTAADIITPPEVEIVNPELYLMTVDNRKKPLTVEMAVGRGRGYLPTDDRKDRLPIGELPIDAIYNPVRKVNFEVGSTRIGQSTEYDKLEIEVWTDGTLEPEEALSRSAKLLMGHLQHLAGVTAESLAAMVVEEEPVERVDEIVDIPIEELDLSVRVFNSLKRTGITTVREVMELNTKGDDALLSIRNFGVKSLTELKDKLEEHGYLLEINTELE
ncbi:MAG TPA: DNA-directed RNA polymerase subunit alpha [Chloroflexi bacterium]|nr:MAG: DNA-directed RNA polymerase subunit alpha [Chloroflexota bacterium]HDD55298.1 DNA-directed RNA polymerase subunit alpha [Chloroflexota bacterium]